MLKRLLIGVTVAALTVMIVRSVPDLQRYRKIRSM